MIAIGGEQFYELAPLLVLNQADPPRIRTIGLALHHAATLWNGSGGVDREVAYIRSIEDYHVNVTGFGLFGYNAIAFPSGNVYIMGTCLGKRAHVGGHNHEYAGIVMAGNYMSGTPSEAMLDGVARWVRVMRRVYGDVPLFPHSLVTAGTAYATSCPGDSGRMALGVIELYAKEDDVLTQDQFNDMLREAIGQTGGYQEAVENYMNNLNQRLLVVEAGEEPNGNQAEIDAIKKKLADAAAVFGR